MICTGLRHRALAYAIKHARENRKAEEARQLNLKLIEEAQNSENQIKDLSLKDKLA